MALVTASVNLQVGGGSSAWGTLPQRHCKLIMQLRTVRPLLPTCSMPCPNFVSARGGCRKHANAPDHREPGIIGLLGMPSQAPTSLESFHMSQTVQSTVSTPVRRTAATNGLINGKSEHVQAIDAALRQSSTRQRSLSQPPQFGDSSTETSVERPYWSIITDGIHCHPQAVNFAYKAHPNGCVLVTDGEFQPRE